MNAFKIRVTIYDETEFCYSLDQMYFLYGNKSQEEFDSDSKEFKIYCREQISVEFVEKNPTKAIEPKIISFWTDRNYGIVCVNDSDVTNFSNQKY